MLRPCPGARLDVAVTDHAVQYRAQRALPAGITAEPLTAGGSWFT